MLESIVPRVIAALIFALAESILFVVICIESLLLTSRIRLNGGNNIQKGLMLR